MYIFVSIVSFARPKTKTRGFHDQDLDSEVQDRDQDL